ncbi:MAG: DUF3465 domain-containing protein [Cocleimonas sp.]|nr:DUF3465 domain-containing protein [Cocleimonas sp.]
MSKQTLIRVIVTLVVAAGVGGYSFLTKDKSYNNSNSTVSNKAEHPTPTLDAPAKTLAKIRTERENPKARFWLETEGEVIKLLKDDTKGSPHQKFLLRLAPDITLLVAHNTALASRVPVEKGDQVKIRARYEWNNRGGVLHWTHHDPKGKQDGGWIYAGGKYYK